MADELPNFVHLHVHSEYSMLDGINRIPDLISKVKADGMNALAITDHGVLYSLYEFWNTCNKEGIKPIIGCEIYVSPSDMQIKQEVDGIKYYHLILLAKNQIGFHNLIKLISKGHLEGFYYRPRVDINLLKDYSEGIICTSGCIQNPLATNILLGRYEKAEEWLLELKNIFKEDFYLELQRHGLFGSDEITEEILKNESGEQLEYLKEQSVVNKQLILWGKKHNIRLIAGTDAHYLNEEDEFTQEVVFAIKDGKTLDDPTRRMPYKYTYIKTRQEMYETFKDIPEVMKNTQEVADKVENYDIKYSRVQPYFTKNHTGRTNKDYLRDLVFSGAKEKYKDITKELEERIDFELNIIHEKGYDDYFLVVSDIIKWARENNIFTGARGSVGGSVVAYCLGIIFIEPIKWECYFERFLNPERMSPPDIDLDIQDNRRDELMAHISKEYGEDKVTAIAAFGKLQTRAAIRDVCRVMGINLSIADTLSKLIKVKYGKPEKIKDSMNNNTEFANIVNSDEKLKKMVEIVSKIEGLHRHVSTHACGYLITPEPVTNYIPVQREAGGSDKVITQIEFGPIEDLGLMKFDFLGLANFSIISITLDLIKKLHNKEIKMNEIPVNDKKTMEMFQNGDTTSVFQFESSGMKRYLKELHPESLEDLCFMAAAYRPGPMEFIEPYIRRKHGKEEVEYLIKELKPITEKTYGIAVYQEQVIKIAVEIAGYTMGQADILRKGIGKKIQAVIDAEKPKFIEGCKMNGFTEKIGERLWEYMLPFANYGFNKAHSAAYAVIGYWTAYLKTHYPLEFMCARLTSDMEKPEKLKVALEEAKNMGIKLKLPDINKSTGVFEPDGDKCILYGLNGVKNVGHNVVEEIVRERSKNGIFHSLDDLCARIPMVNARSLESLIKVGALNEFGEICQMLNIYQTVLQNTTKNNNRINSGQMDIFGSSKENAPIQVTELPFCEPVPISQKLSWEKELLGIYFSSHPMEDHLGNIKNKGLKLLSENEIFNGSNIKGVCIINSLKKIVTKNGEPMAFLGLEDINLSIEAVVFPKDYKKLKDILSEGSIYYLEGKVNKRNDTLSIIINIIKPLDEIDTTNNKSKIGDDEKIIVIRKDASGNDMSNLKEILFENPGEISVSLLLKSEGKSRMFKLKKKVDAGILDEIISKMSMVEKII